MGLQEKLDKLIEAKVEKMLESSLAKVFDKFGLDDNVVVEEDKITKVNIPSGWKPGVNQDIRKATQKMATNDLKKNYKNGNRNVDVYEIDMPKGQRFIDGEMDVPESEFTK